MYTETKAVEILNDFQSPQTKTFVSYYLGFSYVSQCSQLCRAQGPLRAARVNERQSGQGAAVPANASGQLGLTSSSSARSPAAIISIVPVIQGISQVKIILCCGPQNIQEKVSWLKYG